MVSVFLSKTFDRRRLPFMRSMQSWNVLNFRKRTWPRSPTIIWPLHSMSEALFRANMQSIALPFQDRATINNMKTCRRLYITARPCAIYESMCGFPSSAWSSLSPWSFSSARSSSSLPTFLVFSSFASQRTKMSRLSKQHLRIAPPNALVHQCISL